MERVNRGGRRVLRRKYQLKGLHERHHEIKRLIALGMKHKAVAETLDITAENVSAVVGSEIFRHEMQAFQVAMDCTAIDVGQAIIAEGPKSLKLLQQIRDDEVPEEHVPLLLRAKVCTDFLDRNPATAKVKQIQGDIKHSHAVVHTTLENIKERAREAKALAVEIGRAHV